ncbi:fimbrial protein [Pantoea sp. 1.19]|uniref:fimbrial protein n=1 Tax=Pantoea sp. 1.19 TaxID=1925589 RepID=UPI000948A085|nr:fimbrial protein [Pantoea sp. 1.19]
MPQPPNIWLLSLLLLLSPAHSADSTLTITGTLQDNTCEVDTAQKAITVSLGTHAAKQFTAPGSTAPPVPFDLVLSRCGSAARGVKVFFTGTGDGQQPTLLQLDRVSGAAQGVAIALLDAQQAPLPLNATAEEVALLPLRPGQTNVLPFYAQLTATQAPVSAGTISATAAFTLEYP